jgi:hypothetical protein
MATRDTIISRKEKKIFNQNQIDNECVEDLLYGDAWFIIIG